VAGGRSGGPRIGVGIAGGAMVPVAAIWQATSVPSLPAGMLALDNLADICGWLGTYRERLRVARQEDREKIAAQITKMSARYHLRRPELA
jgi:hypothetical protein